VIGLVARAYDRLAQRVGQTTAGVVVLAVAGALWLVLAWGLGEW
jgi:hypothetical protein